MRTDYKKFRVVGPVTVYHHKETGALATKDADNRFKEWKSIQEIERWVQLNYSDFYEDILVVHSSYGGNPPYMRHMQVTYDKPNKRWIVAKTGEPFGYGDRLILDTEEVRASINDRLAALKTLKEQMGKIEMEIWQIVHDAPAPQAPKGE